MESFLFSLSLLFSSHSSLYIFTWTYCQRIFDAKVHIPAIQISIDCVCTLSTAQSKMIQPLKWLTRCVSVSISLSKEWATSDGSQSAELWKQQQQRHQGTLLDGEVKMFDFRRANASVDETIYILLMLCEVFSSAHIHAGRRNQRSVP